MTSELIAAEEALQRGEYRQCLTYLESLSKQFPLSTREGESIRLLMITAWIGQGDDNKAIETCRLLSHSKQGKIREQARQLLAILEAPTLPRPESWSLKIPNINLESSIDSEYLSQSKNKKKSEIAIYHPPTGPTKAFDIGFPLIVLLIISLLTIVLSN